MNKNGWKWILLLVLIGMSIYGAGSGEAAVVFRKAATVCMECIGLG